MVSKLLVLLLLITSATIITATLDENLAQTFAQFKKAPADAGAKLAKLLRVRLGVTTAAELLAIAYSSSSGGEYGAAQNIREFLVEVGVAMDSTRVGCRVTTDRVARGRRSSSIASRDAMRV